MVGGQVPSILLFGYPPHVTSDSWPKMAAIAPTMKFIV